MWETMTTATKTGNPVERIKAEKPGLDILGEIHELAAQHGGWETIAAADRERLKWIGTFFRKPTPGRFMMRLRITNGRITATQLATLASLSRRLGSGVMDLTTRQQIELRDIQIRDVPQILDSLRDIDLTSLQTGMDNIRGTNTCALSGLTPNELFDAAPAGEEFTQMFLNNREYTNLPRKLNVAFTGCLENCLHAETQDIAMTPALGPGGVALNQRKGFNVAVGGKMGSGGMTIGQPLDVFVRGRTRRRGWPPPLRLCSATRAPARSAPGRGWPFSWTTGALTCSASGWRIAGADHCPRRARMPGTTITLITWE